MPARNRKTMRNRVMTSFQVDVSKESIAILRRVFERPATPASPDGEEQAMTEFVGIALRIPFI